MLSVIGAMVPAGYVPAELIVEGFAAQRVTDFVVVWKRVIFFVWTLIETVRVFVRLCGVRDFVRVTVCDRSAVDEALFVMIAVAVTDCVFDSVGVSNNVLVRVGAGVRVRELETLRSNVLVLLFVMIAVA